MSLSPLEQLRSLIEHESGIKLGPDKTELLVNRLRKRLRALGLQSEKQYLEIIESDIEGVELVNLLDVISTNHTYFYREPQHFSQFSTQIEQFVRQGKSEIKIWCAASSSGEEPYFLSMLCDEIIRTTSTKVKILATDISTFILRKAIRGVYEYKQVDKLPEKYLKNYFNQLESNGETVYEVIPSIKQSVAYKKLNLSKFPFPLNGPIDIIFCRNVMIYFDIPLRQKIINEFYRLLSHNGTLYLSHSENLLGVTHEFKSVDVGAYRKS